MRSHPESLPERLTESTRVEAFSDGVFAIALTLLVLDLHVPEGGGEGFGHSLLAQWPSYVAYLAAFLNIASIWINHHDLFSRVKQVDIGLICANLALLLVTSLFPWPASVISAAVREGTGHDEVVAAVLYAGVGLLVPLAWILLYRYVSGRPHLLVGAADVRYARDSVRRSLLAIVVYPLAALLALFAPTAAIILFVLVPLFFIVSLLVVPPTRATR